MTRDPKDTCEHCPAFMKHLDYEGREVLVPLRDLAGQTVTKDGAVQYEKGADGRFLFAGNCCLHAPQLFNNMTVFPSPKSNWFCEDPARYLMLDRLKEAP
jgi:hypothetical protein